MSIDVKNALNALKMRFIDGTTTANSFFLKECGQEAVDLVEQSKKFNFDINDIIEDNFEIKVDISPYSIHALKRNIENKDSFEQFKKTIPFFEQDDYNNIINSSDKINKLTNFYHKKYISYYTDLESTVLNIIDHANINNKSFGKQDLYIGYPFGECKYPHQANDDTIFRGPLCLTPVKLSFVKNNIIIKKSGKSFVNPNLVILSQLINPINGRINEINTEVKNLENFDDIIEVLRNARTTVDMKYENDYKVFDSVSKSAFKGNDAILEGMKIKKHVVLGIFDLTNRALYKEFEQILSYDYDENSTFLKLLDEEGRNNIRMKKEYNEDNVKLMSTLDMYQGIAVNEAVSSSFAVQGPPGTGKTEVIANIIFNSLNDGQSVLVVTEKPSAMDVIESRISLFQNHLLNLTKITNISQIKEKIDNTLNGNMQIYNMRPYYTLNELPEYYNNYKSYIDTFKRFDNCGYSIEEIFLNEIDKKDNDKELFSFFNRNEFYKVNLKELLNELFNFGLLNQYKNRKKSLEYYNITELLANYTNNEFNQLSSLVKAFEFSGEQNLLKFVKKLDKNSEYNSLFDKKFKTKEALKIIQKIGIDKVQNMEIPHDCDYPTIQLINLIIDKQYDSNYIKEQFLKYLYKYWVYTSEKSTSFIKDYERRLKKAVEDYENKVSNDKELVYNNFMNKIIRSINSDPSLNTMISNLRREVTNNKFTLRQLITNYYEVIAKLYKVIFATPSIVSELLPFKEGLFDVVIFDEASQQTIEKSIPILFRAKRIVACGDEKQMSPSTTFSRDLGNYDEQEVGNYSALERNLIYSKSLLDFVSNQYDSDSLNYHYRSQSHKLVRFSNKEFYNNELIVTDVAKEIENPLIVINVNGEYEDQRNKQEAEKAIELLFDIVATKETNDTIGIITMNRKQKDYVENILPKKLATLKEDNTELYFKVWKELYEREDGKNTFIKNLESVQGDERDIIIISLVFGPMYEGDAIKYPSSFGPLAQVGGEKRLNVAITRAKKRMYVLKSLSSHNLTGTYKHPGVNVFKSMLDYFENDRYEDVVINNTLNNPIALEIKNKLADRLPKNINIECNKVIGSFEVQIALFDTINKEYILGIKLEDMNIRDNFKEKLFNYTYLVGRGWKIYNLFYYNWICDPQLEITQILSKIDDKYKK